MTGFCTTEGDPVGGFLTAQWTAGGPPSVAKRALAPHSYLTRQTAIVTSQYYSMVFLQERRPRGCVFARIWPIRVLFGRPKSPSFLHWSDVNGTRSATWSVSTNSNGFTCNVIAWPWKKKKNLPATIWCYNHVQWGGMCCSLFISLQPLTKLM